MMLDGASERFVKRVYIHDALVRSSVARAKMACRIASIGNLDVDRQEHGDLIDVKLKK